MNNTFNTNRFGLLFKKTIAERPIQTIGVTVLLLLLSFILYVVAKKLSGFGAAQNLTFIWGLPGGGFFLASFVFGYFNKIPFIKTCITVCIVLFVIVGLNWIIATVLFGNVNDAAPYDHVTLAVGKEEGTLILPSGIENFFHYSLAFAIPAMLWILPLSRLREKEF